LWLRLKWAVGDRLDADLAFDLEPELRYWVGEHMKALQEMKCIRRRWVFEIGGELSNACAAAVKKNWGPAQAVCTPAFSLSGDYPNWWTTVR
jgi:hypothetical protein